MTWKIRCVGIIFLSFSSLLSAHANECENFLGIIVNVSAEPTHKLTFDSVEAEQKFFRIFKLHNKYKFQYPAAGEKTPLDVDFRYEYNESLSISITLTDMVRYLKVIKEAHIGMLERLDVSQKTLINLFLTYRDYTGISFSEDEKAYFKRYLAYQLKLSDLRHKLSRETKASKQRDIGTQLVQLIKKHELFLKRTQTMLPWAKN